MSFFEHNVNGLVYLTSDMIEPVHAFTTRLGGVSEGMFSSLNLRVVCSDKPENVQENYNRLCSALDIPLENFVYTKQTHTTIVKAVTKDDRKGLFEMTEEETDGLVTKDTNVPIIAYTADCIPILLYDPVKKAIGAVHAGWRGTVAGIAGEGIRKMVSEYDCDPADIKCAIGPGIGACCFETHADVPEKVSEELESDGDQFITKLENGKFLVDLKAINVHVLKKNGVKPGNIDVCDECTCCLNEKYWSHRYTKGQRGCQACVIMLRG